MDHFPMSHPLAAGALALLPFGAAYGSAHAVLDAGFRSNWNVGFHSALPERVLAKAVRRIDSAAHAVFIVAHVAINHGDGIDGRLNELPVPCHRVGYAVDVIPAAGVETDEMRPKGS